MLQTDLLIIGGSIAGSSLNFLLKDSDLQIIVLDKAQFPRSKACGEGLSSLVTELFQLLEKQPSFLSLPHVPYKNYVVHTDTYSVKLGDNSGNKGVGIERSALDNFLSYSSNANSRRITGKLQELEFREEKWIASTGDCKIAAKFIVIADGYKSATCKKLGISRTTENPSRFGLSSWWETEVGHGITDVDIFCIGEAALYITPVTKTKINATVLGSISAVKTFKANPQLFADKIKEKYGLIAIRHTELLGAGPFQSKLETFHSNNALVIGDSAETFDPASGLGMYHSIFSSYLASDILQNLNKNKHLVLSEYSSRLNRHNRFLRIYNSLICYMIENINRSLFLKVAAKTGLIAAIDKMLSQILILNLKQSARLSPIMTLDKILLASLWSLYCFIGPVFKERRFSQIFKEKLTNYKLRTPYFFPIGKRNN